MKYESCTDSEWGALIEEWRNEKSELSLQEYLKLNTTNYTRERYGLPNIALTFKQSENEKFD